MAKDAYSHRCTMYMVHGTYGILVAVTRSTMALYFKWNALFFQQKKNQHTCNVKEGFQEITTRLVMLVWN